MEIEPCIVHGNAKKSKQAREGVDGAAKEKIKRPQVDNNALAPTQEAPKKMTIKRKRMNQGRIQDLSAHAVVEKESRREEEEQRRFEGALDILDSFLEDTPLEDNAPLDMLPDLPKPDFPPVSSTFYTNPWMEVPYKVEFMRHDG